MLKEYGEIEVAEDEAEEMSEAEELDELKERIGLLLNAIYFRYTDTDNWAVRKEMKMLLEFANSHGLILNVELEDDEDTM